MCESTDCTNQKLLVNVEIKIYCVFGKIYFMKLQLLYQSKKKEPKATHKVILLPYDFLLYANTLTFHFSLISRCILRGWLRFHIFYDGTYSNTSFHCTSLLDILLDLIFMCPYIDCLLWSKDSHSQKTRWVVSVTLLHCLQLSSPFNNQHYFAQKYSYFIQQITVLWT